jgi:hypothetical protein
LSFGDSDEPVITIELCYDTLQLKYSNIGAAKAQNTFAAFGEEVAPSIEFEYGGFVGKPEFIGVKPRYFLSQIDFSYSQNPTFPSSSQQCDLMVPKEAFNPGVLGMSNHFLIAEPFSTTAVLVDGDFQFLIQNIFFGTTYFVDSFSNAKKNSIKEFFTDTKGYASPFPKIKVSRVSPIFNLAVTLVNESKVDCFKVDSSKEVAILEVFRKIWEHKFFSDKSVVDGGELYPQVYKVKLPKKLELCGLVQDFSLENCSPRIGQSSEVRINFKIISSELLK